MSIYTIHVHQVYIDQYDQKRKSLEQIHIFALAHILRRPVVVYGVKMVKNFRGENLGLANFEGTCACTSMKSPVTTHTCTCTIVYTFLSMEVGALVV